jgi:hypothetical protein
LQSVDKAYCENIVPSSGRGDAGRKISNVRFQAIDLAAVDVTCCLEPQAHFREHLINRCRDPLHFSQSENAILRGARKGKQSDEVVLEGMDRLRSTGSLEGKIAG